MPGRELHGGEDRDAPDRCHFDHLHRNRAGRPLHQLGFPKHKGNVNGISLEKVLVSVASINTGNASTQLSSGSVLLRADGAPADGSQDVKVGTVSALVFHDYLVSSAGGGGKTFSLSLDNAQALNKFLMDKVVRGSGKFSAVVNA